MGKVMLITDIGKASTPMHLHLAPEASDPVGLWLWERLNSRTGATKTDYLRAFHRIPLCLTNWSPNAGEEYWNSIREDCLEKCDYIVFVGPNPKMVAGVQELLPRLGLRGGFGAIPHPMSRDYTNHPLCIDAVEILLEELYIQAIA